MAASLEVSQNKRSRDEYSNTGLTSPEAKRANSVTYGYDSDLMAFLANIDKMDNNEEIEAVNQIEGETMLSGAITSLKDEIRLKGSQTYNDIESTDEKGRTDKLGSNQQGRLTADRYSEATRATSNIEDFTYFDDVRADRDFFLDNITPDEFGIIMQNYLDGDSVPDIMYSDTVHGYVESREISYGSLWEDDIWQVNEHPVIQHDFGSPAQEDFGIVGAQFHPNQ